MQPTPEDRACLEWACRIVFGIDADDEIVVLPHLTVVWDGDRFKLNPANSAGDASIATLAQMMKYHLTGFEFAELRDDLLRSGVNEEFADRVYDHLKDVSDDEWDRLRRHVDAYRNMLDSDTEFSGADYGR